MFGYIYKTTNMKNNRIYVGKKHKPTFVKDYYGSGVLINKSIDKYGIDCFKVEMIDTANSLEELNSKEKFWIKELKSQTIFGNYNIADGGFGGDIFSHLPEDMKKSFIEKCKRNTAGEKNPNYGNGYKIAGDKNPSKRPEVRKKISMATSGERNGMYGIKPEDHPMYGKKMSEESKQKMRETRKNKKPIQKKCLYCNSPFEAMVKQAKFCTPLCKGRQHRDNKKK